MVVAFILAFALVCHGWGGLVSRFCYRGLPIAVAFNIALGLTVLNFLGGLLNALHAAKPLALHLLCLVGAGLSIGSVIQSLHGRRAGMSENGRLIFWSADILAISLAAFFAVTLLPTGGFNIHDDFHTYLVRPIQMLATGTMGGNPFDPLGLDSFGTQSFFQAFFLLLSPIQDINAFDAVFCFAVSGCLIGAMGRRLKVHPAMTALAVLTSASINPQFVNIAPIYSGSLMIGAFLLATLITLEQSASDQWRRWLPVGLICATLVGLKLPLAFYCAFFLTALFGLRCAGTILRKRQLVEGTSEDNTATPNTQLFKGVIVAGVTAFIATIAWIVVIAPTYVKAHGLAAVHSAGATLTSKYHSVAAHDLKRLFKDDALFYGGNHVPYRLILLGLIVTVAISTWRCQRSRSGDVRGMVIGPAAFAAGAVYLLNGHLFNVSTAVRYSCPILIGVVPIVALLCSRMLQAEGDFEKQPRRFLSGRAPVLAVVAFQFVILFLFFPVSVARAQQAQRARTLLAFPFTPGYLDYNGYVFGPEGAAHTRQLQEKIEPGQGVLIWMALPFQFDFARNPVFSVSEPGLVNPPLRFPAGIADEALADYFRSWGIRYVMLETEGYAIKSIADLEKSRGSSYPIFRKIADYSIYTRRTLGKLADKYEVIHREDDLIMFDLGRCHAPNEAATETDETLP